MKKITYLLILFLLLVGCKQNYLITFHVSGGEKIETIEAQKGQEVTLPVPTREGFTFTGWNDRKGNIYNGKITVNENLDLYAEWEINFYRVRFVDDENNLIEEQRIKYQENAKPPLPNKPGYAFVGWNRDYTNIKSDLEIKAIFTKMTPGLIFTEEDNCYLVSGYEGTDTKVIIPSHYKGLPVRKIGDNAFLNHRYITEVVLPENIEIIGKDAFAHASMLTSINFPNSLILIDERAFQHTQLTKIETNAQTIASLAFYGCSEVTEIILGEDVKYLGDLAFFSCAITEIYLPSSIEYLGAGIFNWCKKLKEIKTLKSNVAKIKSLIENAKLIYTSPKVVGIE